MDTKLECHVTLEHQGAVVNKQSFRSARLALVRNEFRELYLDISINSERRTMKHRLKSIQLHNKFMKEGKASISFKEEKLNLLISNAPVSQLFDFLKLLTMKMMGDSDDAVPKTRTKLLSCKPQSVEDISPLTEKDVNKAREKLKKVITTPTGTKTDKRKLSQPVPDPKKKRCLLAVEELSKEQLEVLNAAKRGSSIFFTGSAGTGKSHLLRKIISVLPPDVTFATASTGVAACQIGGSTIHQFAGMGTGDGTLEHCIKLASRPNSRQIWRRCKHLIIDEISMIHGDFFEKLEHVARITRNSERPFGGIQLILCGDFFQLPPVSDRPRFCFEASVWEKCIDVSFELKQIHRQSDPEFIDILQSVRIGRVTDEIAARLSKTSCVDIETNGILATRLCTHTAEANSINETKLSLLSGKEHVFACVDEPYGYSDILDKQCPVANSLTLKVGAQVMLMKNVNVSSGLVNGARGVVQSVDKDGLPVVQFRGTTYKVKRERFVLKLASGMLLTRHQLPLGLAWAFSIHKSQGLTLDCVEMCLSRVFEAGHAYVALSRVKNLQSLRIIDFDKKQVWANNKVLVYYQKFRRRIQALRLIPLGNKKLKI